MTSEPQTENTREEIKTPQKTQKNITFKTNCCIAYLIL